MLEVFLFKTLKCSNNVITKKTFTDILYKIYKTIELLNTK